MVLWLVLWLVQRLVLLLLLMMLVLLPCCLRLRRLLRRCCLMAVVLGTLSPTPWRWCERGERSGVTLSHMPSRVSAFFQDHAPPPPLPSPSLL